MVFKLHQKIHNKGAAKLSSLFVCYAKRLDINKFIFKNAFM